jgi:hypothetical protein
MQSRAGTPAPLIKPSRLQRVNRIVARASLPVILRALKGAHQLRETT